MAMLPLLWATAKQTMLMIPTVGQDGFHAWGLYAGGLLSYLALERVMAKPMWLYVVGHELTHAVSGLISGAKIHSFKAGARGGEVRLSKSNIFIALSPYIVPIYAVLVISVYAVLKRWWFRPEIVYGFQWFLGMAIAFHLSLTISALHKHQPDLKILGFFLSGVIIALGNALILGILGVSLFSKTPTFKEYFYRIMRDTQISAKSSAGWAFESALWAGEKMNRYRKDKKWIR